MNQAGRILYVATILTGSFLLFLVQPMVARIALPRLGGASAVWNSAMLVYQALLLGGYGYAHLLARLAPRRQGAIHLGVLLVACAFLPIGLSDGVLPAGAEPALWVPWLFAVSIGPLFFAVSAQAPLVQRWFSLARPGDDPYALYAASNLGSFAGLLAYPLLVEPLLPVTQQRWLWSAGYLLLIALVAACVVRLPAARADAPVRDAGADEGRRPVGPWRVVTWIVLGLVPSGMMLATSTFISTDIVAMPLLWVMPLSLYLLSFSVAFAANRTPADFLTRYAPFTIVIFGGIMMGGFTSVPLLSTIVALVLLFMASVALHTRLYRLRPAPERLTGFYLATSFGGALGGVFAGLVAPVLFDWTWEYPILIVAAGLLVPQTFFSARLRRLWHEPASRLAAFATTCVVFAALLWITASSPQGFFSGDYNGAIFLVVAVLGIATVGARLPYMLVLVMGILLFGGMRSLILSIEPGTRSRSYFGTYLVTTRKDQWTLAHGTTIHGVQLRGSPERERTPTTYYTRGSGVGRVLTAAPALFGPRARIGIVGLGTGTLACYRRAGQRWTFYEIDPTMTRIASGAPFTFLRRCARDARIVIGDARLSIAREAPGALYLLALDAFSSDSVPMHLLTREAFADYARALQPGGVLVVHISNRYLDLAPVVAAAAANGGWHAAGLDHAPDAGVERGSKSLWIALSRDPAVLRRLSGGDPAWTPLRSRAGFAAWTDDYATILPLLKR